MRRDVKNMPVRKILVYPDKKLKKTTKPVEPKSDNLNNIIIDMLDTFDVSPGCVGLAAPQIGIELRMIIVDVSGSKQAKKKSSVNGNLLCFNPVITKKEGSIQAREGCLSVPDFTGNVIRSQSITLNFLDEKFQPHKIEAYGFEAIVFQHEIDHLDGLLFLDRVRSFKKDVFHRKIYQKPKTK